MNIADEFFAAAKINPTKDAIRFEDKAISFSQLETDIHSYAAGLTQQASIKGKKVLLFLRPGIEFPAIVFSLFKVGAIPIFIDPGMGLKNLLAAIEEVEPEIMIAEPIVYALRFFHPASFKSIKQAYISKKRILTSAIPLSSLKRADLASPSKAEEMAPDELCAILFTSGGTGTPKGVEYTHKIFSTQTKLLRDIFNLTPSDVDIPGFPLFSLFALNMGMTSCPPPMNPSKPAAADPQKLYQCISKNKGTFIAGSPAIWEKLADYCQQQHLKLPTVKYLVMFGAPVSVELHRKFLNILPNGTTFTPYGATESLPVACISGKEVLKDTASESIKGKGTCVGKLVPSIEAKIIRPSTDAIPDLREAEELPCGEIGEIVVSGDTITARYYKRAKETARAKIYQTLNDGKIRIWHRIGDMGKIDESGRLWFCGRASHAVKINNQFHYSIPVEAIFNQHHEVKRSAMIEYRLAKNNPELAIVVERRDKKILKGKEKKNFEQELIALAKKFAHTESISKVFFHKQFPVDVRHNIKIDRLRLRDHFNQIAREEE